MEDKHQRLRCRVKPEHRGQRLDQFLPLALAAQHGVDLSRRATRRALQAGAVYVEGRRVRVASRAMNAGDRVEIVLEFGDQGPRTAEGREPPPLGLDQILYQDDHLIAIHKPAGLPTQATQTDALGHAEEMVRRFLSHGPNDRPYLSLHHRLDRGTSGVLLMVKNRAANKGVANAFRDGQVRKTYWLISAVAPGAVLPAVDGEEALILDSPLGRDGRKTVLDGLGQEARTEVRLRRRFTVGGTEWLFMEARPLTGRRHQIRAHLAAAGMPILGDRLYSPAPISGLTGRPMLHAQGLRIQHPLSDQVLEVSCPPPSDFRQCLEHLESGRDLALHQGHGSSPQGGGAGGGFNKHHVAG